MRIARRQHLPFRRHRLAVGTRIVPAVGRARVGGSAAGRRRAVVSDRPGSPLLPARGIHPDNGEFARRHGLAVAARRGEAAGADSRTGDGQARTAATFSDKWRRFRSYGMEPSHQEFLFGWYCKKLGLPERQRAAGLLSREEADPRGRAGLGVQLPIHGGKHGGTGLRRRHLRGRLHHLGKYPRAAQRHRDPRRPDGLAVSRQLLRFHRRRRRAAPHAGYAAGGQGTVSKAGPRRGVLLLRLSQDGAGTPVLRPVHPRGVLPTRSGGVLCSLRVAHRVGPGTEPVGRQDHADPPHPHSRHSGRHARTCSVSSTTTS